MDSRNQPVFVLGTANRKKGAELVDLFGPLGFDVRTLADFPAPLEVEETGKTFQENAALKATQQARHLGHWVLGEDSGLVVDALQGEPGVFSRRYSGPQATDASNNRLLLERLKGIPPEGRAARYVCRMALADPAGTVHAEAEGCCHGQIRLEPQGTHGFGYDPLFEVIEYHRSFGLLGPAVKRCLSHRARAARTLIPRLIELCDSDTWTRPDPS